MLFSNVNGARWPMERTGRCTKGDRAAAVLYIHPAHPVGVEAMTEYWLMPLVGFLMDTTLAAAKLVFSGVPQRFPGIRWVLGHLGGAIPYLAERLDRGYEAFGSAAATSTAPPSEYLRVLLRHGELRPGALELAIGFAGVERILAGSDYPHQIGSIPKMLDVAATRRCHGRGAANDSRRQRREAAWSRKASTERASEIEHETVLHG